MRYAVSTLALTFALHQMLLFTIAAGTAEPLPEALAELAETERAFARRARVVGWKAAFLEYFADTAVGFATGEPSPAKEGIRRQPDPPTGSELLWEPRTGDVAASGELGWLTGPVQTRSPGRDSGRPRFSTYASIWKRQDDGRFRVVLDIGAVTPSEPPFAHGFTRARLPHRYAGVQIAPLAEASLVAAERALLHRARRSLADAYRPVLTDSSRVHRSGRMPLVGAGAALTWLQTQPPLTDGEPLYAEVARSADLGYAWGTYAARGAAGARQTGHYVRVWVRDAAGVWRLALDVVEARPPRPS